MKKMSTDFVTPSELENSKTEYLSLLDETLDREDSMLENMVAKNLLNLDEFDVRREAIKKVTIKDIQKIAKKVYIDTIYLLKGDLNEKK